MTKLKAVKPKDAKPSKTKVLVFGKPGVGKTFASLDFPVPYYIDTEGGADRSHYTDKLQASGGDYLGTEQGSLSFETLIEQVKALATEKHHYKTLIIDSITKIFALEIQAEADRLGDKNAFGADKKPAIAYMRKLVGWLQRLDMNVIIIAHSKSEWGIDGKGERTEVGQTFDAWDKLEYELDLCLEIIKQTPKSRKARVRKSRLLGFPDGEVFDWSYSSFAERYGKDAIEGDTEAVVLASDEQLKELRDLIDLFKVDQATQAKWLKAGNCDDYADMDGDKVLKIINHLKSKINNKEGDQ